MAAAGVACRDSAVVLTRREPAAPKKPASRPRPDSARRLKADVSTGIIVWCVTTKTRRASKRARLYRSFAAANRSVFDGKALV